MYQFAILTSAILILAQTADLDTCFQAFRSYRFECAEYIEKKSLPSLAGCQEWCLSRPADCLSAQYDYYRKICQIYNTPSPMEDSSKNERPGSFRFYRSIAQGQAANKKDCVPELRRALGVVHLIPSLDCLLPEDKTNIRHSEPLMKHLPTYPISKSEPASDSEPEPEKPTKKEKRPQTPFADNVIQVLPVVPDCPVGERARVQIIDGVQVDSEPTVSFQVDLPEKCVEACRTSTYPDTSRLPLLCRSASFDRLSLQCSLFHDSLNPNGYLEYRPDFNVIYMEKICIPERILPTSCDDVFRRVPQHVLLGHAAEILTSTSQAECIRECIRAKDRDLHCRSIIYYLEVPLQNCILNIHTRNSRPEYFIPELRYKVDYIELSPCATLPIAQLVQVPSLDNSASLGSHDAVSVTVLNPSKDLPDGKPSVESNWSEWTSCDASTGLRERDRICTDCTETVQAEPCFANSNNEFDTALKQFIREQGEAKPSQNDVEHDVARLTEQLSEPKIIPFPSHDDKVVAEQKSDRDVEFFGPPMDLSNHPLNNHLRTPVYF